MDNSKKNEIAARCAKRLGKRLLDTLSPDGDGTLWSEHMARVAMLDALDEMEQNLAPDRTLALKVMLLRVCDRVDRCQLYGPTDSAREAIKAARNLLNDT